MASPLIITLRLNEAAFDYFNELRKKYFPAEINFLSAHLTLFHHLPHQDFIADDLSEWSKQQQTMELKVAELKMIGRGVAFKIESPALLHLHQQMQLRWKQWLTPQDAQRLWPHVTVQNKVTVEAAKKTFQTLTGSFNAFIAYGTGFDLWSYENGPWKFINHFSFRQHL